MRTLSFFILALLLSSQAYTQTLSGKELFTGNCQACHSIGGGDIVGPDLAGIMEKREEAWVKDFITNSQSLIASGDKEAEEVFAQYNKIIMPPHNFSEEEMGNLLAYINEAGQEASLQSEQVEEAPVEEKEAQVVSAQSGETNWLVNALLGILGLAVIILVVLSGYLYRMLKNMV